MTKRNQNPLPQGGKGSERTYDIEDMTDTSPRQSGEQDQSVNTTVPVPAPTQTGALGTGVNRGDHVLNTEPTNETPGAGLDLSRDSYQGDEERKPEEQGINPDEYHAPLTIGDQVVQRAPLTAHSDFPPGEVPLPGKEEFNADDQGRNPYPVPVEGTSARHVAYGAGEVDSEKES